MPKRECPFDYDLIPQCKVHIGEKEVNSGAMEFTNMKNVYAKTMQLLFQGAKSNHAPVIPQAVETGCREDGKLYKQMFLKSNCELQSSGILLSQPLSECDMCKVALKLSSSTPCDFCDRRLCHDCSFMCVKCCDNFCSNCILQIYSGPGDSQMCISCVH